MPRSAASLLSIRNNILEVFVFPTKDNSRLLHIGLMNSNEITFAISQNCNDVNVLWLEVSFNERMLN